ncbi:MAG: conjugal transfer protein TraB [Nevskiaceae bacterium]|nr:MAG: conjugal transfer protein TraB [Nevskiaceae bacterium]
MIPGISGRFRRPVFSAWRGRSSFSIPDRFLVLLLVAAAAVVGCIGWSGHVLALPLAMLFPALWAGSKSRITAAAVSAGYFLAASRGLPQSVATFFGTTVWAGILLWFAASISFVAVHAALWSRRRRWIAIRYLIAVALMAIPPFGIVGWAHPITAAGVLFPGWGWWGLGAAVGGLAAMTMRLWPVATFVLACAWLWSAMSWTFPSPPDQWQGIDTSLSASLGQGNALDQHHALVELVLERERAGAKVVVLPESTLGLLTPTVERFWTDALAGRDVTVVAGGADIDPAGYDNVMVSAGARGASVLYRSRMSVPVSMWQPWRAWLGENGGAGATFFADPVVEVAGRRVVPLICYEQLLVWPVLQSMLHRPDTIVAIANGWWAAGTSVPAIQRAATEAWARLFDLPLVTAFNR